MSDAEYSVFDKGGKYLFFAANTRPCIGGNVARLSGFQRPVTRSVYAVVLKRAIPSCRAAERRRKSCEARGKIKRAEKDKDKSKEKDKARAKTQTRKTRRRRQKEEPVTVIDFAESDSASFPLPLRLQLFLPDAGQSGNSLRTETPLVQPLDGPPFPQLTMSKFDLTTRKTEPFLSEISGYSISRMAKRFFIAWARRRVLAATAAAPKPARGPQAR